MPNSKDEGFVDYVHWGDDGKPLALTEVKRTRKDARIGQQQAKLYADCLEKMFGQRPIIFYSNGYEHWIWDDVNYPPRKVQGFYKKAELELLIQRRTTRKLLKDNAVKEKIVERPYQIHAIRRIGEAFEKDKDRKALLVMATGAGKTRTAIALVDLLMRCNYVKRVLFLADRVALVRQAVNAFKKHLPDSSPVNLVTDKDTEGRIFVSTHPTMMGLIDETLDGQRRFGSGHFDLVFIDEAHRSVFQKYRSIFEYFDSLLVGLTATPKEEVDRNTYSLFDLENGVPTDAYSLEEAVKDKFLVPAKAVSVPVKFQRDGIKYDDLSEDEKDQWDALEWEEEGVPDKVESEAVNKWLFNKDTVDKVIAHLMTHGIKVAGGDRLGKTIIFAKNIPHAEFIAERFNINYPHLKGEFARVVTYETKYAQTLIDDFSRKNSNPHIAISVDMLDTGIDVPEVVNLVFFKLVRSKTKFWQMIGRGTRLCPDLFEPGVDKKFFYIFDYCQNLEFFSQNTEMTEGVLLDSLGTRLFKSRLELILKLDSKLGPVSGPPKISEPASTYGEASTDAEVRREFASFLYTEVAAMNLDNFIVRPRRRLVEKYSRPEAWLKLEQQDYAELYKEVSWLPSELESEEEEAKRFDLLLFKLELALLRAEPVLERLRKKTKNPEELLKNKTVLYYFNLYKKLQTIASLLEEKANIPKVKEQLPLILDIQATEWWQDPKVPSMEKIRKRLRALIYLIDKHGRKIIYADFEDAIGESTEIIMPGFTSAGDFEKFKAKARAFLRDHQNHASIRKLRMNEALTAEDLAELERLLAESGIGDANEISRAKSESHGLGVFVRSLVGLDREAAKKALGNFLTGKTMNANQIEFVNMIVDHLTEHGVMDAALLYESPFTDITPKGPDSIFTPVQIDKIFMILNEIQSRALAA